MKHLLLTALLLLSATNVLEEYIEVISSNRSSRRLINKKLQHTKRCIVPMFSYAANSALSPLINLGTQHDERSAQTWMKRV